MTLPAPYRYKLRPRPPKQPLNRLAGLSDAERLVGFVQGKEASDLEERFANALSLAGKEFRFQIEVTGPATLPQEQNQIDFLVEDIYPVEVDGEFTHKTAAQKAHDQIRDAILNDYLSDFGWYPIERIKGADLETQEAANQVAEEMF